MKSATANVYGRAKERCQEVKQLIVPSMLAVAMCVVAFALVAAVVGNQLARYTSNRRDIQRLWRSQGMGKDSLDRSVEFLNMLLQIVEVKLYLHLAVVGVTVVSLCLIKSEFLDAARMNKVAWAVFTFLNIEEFLRAMLYIIKTDVVTVIAVAIAMLWATLAVRGRLGKMGLILGIVYLLPIVALMADLCIGDGRAHIRSSMVRISEYKNIGGGLYKKITALAARHGLTEASIYVENSARTNAYAMSGLRFKFISIYSRMFEAMDDDQLLGVVAHELGHITHHDSLVLGALLVTVGAVLLAIGGFAYLAMRKSYHGLAISLVALYSMSLAELLFGLSINLLVCHSFESRADANACRANYGGGLIEALRILIMDGHQGRLFDYDRAFGSLLSHLAVYKRIQAVGQHLAAH